MKKTLGGDRLGSGKKMEVELKEFSRSNHDLSFVFRSTMAAGTLVPFMSEVLLPGDTMDIDLDCEVLTKPTIGPLYGSYKVQLDVFEAPIRLYQGMLHQNTLGIGNNMSGVKLPQMAIGGVALNDDTNPDNQHINPSSIMRYLGVGGIGDVQFTTFTFREFNAVPWLAYWEIYKNYYANKQEQIGAVIHNSAEAIDTTVTEIAIGVNSTDEEVLPYAGVGIVNITISNGKSIFVRFTGTPVKPEEIYVQTRGYGTYVAATQIWKTWGVSGSEMVGTDYIGLPYDQATRWRYILPTDTKDLPPRVQTFPLTNIDNMRNALMGGVTAGGKYVITDENQAPYGWALESSNGVFSLVNSQEGLAIKTFQSDIFNNWLQTEWIGGVNGVSAVTAIDTTSGSFTIDTLQIKTKVYNMLNAIAVSGGSYHDYINAAYDHRSYKNAESPMYHGGLIKELVFQEVIATSASNADGSQPLGQLGGRGRLTNKNKGGKVTIKADEHGYMIGIVSLTPRLDYSQGNRWDVNLKSMADFHVPYLDQIGFQDLITEQMAWWDTKIDNVATLTQYSAGKQPAWINYQTNYNRTFGNFAIEDTEMFMTLNRRYERNSLTGRIVDLTTYIDPAKFNNIFAEEARDAQNFWVQIGVNIMARRKMSAKLMPNL